MTLVEQYRTTAGARAKSNVEESASSDPMTQWVIIGWAISFAGAVLWIYGYLYVGNSPLIDWYAKTPLWIAQFLRNIQSEAGIASSFAGMMLICWPRLR
jgi:hypothetical protein